MYGDQSREFLLEYINEAVKLCGTVMVEQSTWKSEVEQ